MFRTGHWYHFITAGFFLLFGGFLLIFNPEFKGINAGIFGTVLILWGLFRGLNGYLLLRRKKREESQ
jgi:hypothetical protein